MNTTKQNDISLSEHINDVCLGRKEFVHDLVLCQDLIDEYKNTTVIEEVANVTSFNRFEHNDSLTEKAKNIEKYIELIFPFSLRHKLNKAVNFIRMDAWVNYVADENGVDVTDENGTALQLLIKIGHMAKDLSSKAYQGKVFELDTEEDTQKAEKTLSRFKTILYQYHKKSSKKNKPISYSLLTPGTVVVRNICGIDKGEDKIFTVDTIYDQATGHVLITALETEVTVFFSGNPFPQTKQIDFSSGHVKSILKHVPGKVKVERGYEGVGLEKHAYMSKIGKSSNCYYGHDVRSLIMLIVENLYPQQKRDLHTAVNWDVLSRLVFDSLGYSVKGEFSSIGFSRFMDSFVINKNKMKRAVRQNYNRALSTMKTQLNQAELMDQMSAESMMDTADHDEMYPSDAVEFA